MTKFSGSTEELTEALAPVLGNASWRKLNENQFQLRDKNGAILNWYPSTGTINYQGTEEAIPELQGRVSKLLDKQNKIPSKENESRPKAQTGKTAQEALHSSSYHSDLGQQNSELVIGLVGAVGTELTRVVEILKQRLEIYNYKTTEIKVSSDIIAPISAAEIAEDEYQRIEQLMTLGNQLRETTGDNAVLALGAASKINQIRSDSAGVEDTQPLPRHAFIISSLKHPEEVQQLRKIYTHGFFLFGIYSEEQRRRAYLTRNKNIPSDKAEELIQRDADESLAYGQHTRDTFHLADFFINYSENSDKNQHEIWRSLDLIFGNPFVTPTFDEFAMFMAFSASLRSADLSRQVGAVITKEKNILSTGANDVPKAGGGLYWPQFDSEKNMITDAEDGRDYMRGVDSNTKQKNQIIEEIISNAPVEDAENFRGYLERSKIKDITEYGRMAHAEMEAILACGRNGVSTIEATLHCTTFPCHNCAKHIIASGVTRVVYVEPYPKSKAFEFHSDAVTSNRPQGDDVIFEPFEGVGPRSFFNLFSMKLGSGYPVVRKRGDGRIVEWEASQAELRMQMQPISYIERETYAASVLNQYIGRS